MRGESGGGIPQPAEVDDAFDTGALRRGAEIARGLRVAFGEISARSKAVDKVIGDSGSLHGIREGIGPQNVAFDGLDLISPRPALQSSRISHKAAHPIARVQ